MKKIRNVVLILALFLSINGCEKNPVEDELTQNNGEFTIEQAQGWFGNEWTGILSLKSGSSEKTKIGIKPDWCDGFTSQNKEVEVVEVGLLVQGKFGFVEESSYNDWKTKKNPQMITSITRLVFLKYKKDGRIVQFLMTIVGDKEYLEKKVGRLAENSYLSRGKHFSGYIFYHDLSGNFANGWNYANGKIVGKCSQIGINQYPLVLKSAVCMAVTVTLYSQFCTDWYTNGWYNYTTCENREVEDEFYYLSCAYEPSGDDDGEGGYGGAGGGGDPEPEPAPNIDIDCNFANSVGINCEVLLAFENDYKTRMSSSELVIFENMTRVQQLSYLSNAQFATWESEDLFPNSLL